MATGPPAASAGNGERPSPSGSMACTVRGVAGQWSLTRCGFDDDLTLALCVQESMPRPPALVRVHLANGKIAPIAAQSPRHEEIGIANVRTPVTHDHIVC